MQFFYEFRNSPNKPWLRSQPYPDYSSARAASLLLDPLPRHIRVVDSDSKKRFGTRLWMTRRRAGMRPGTVYPQVTDSRAVNRNPLVYNYEDRPTRYQLRVAEVAMKNGRPYSLANGVFILASEMEAFLEQRDLPPKLPGERGKTSPRERYQEARRREDPDRHQYTVTYKRNRTADRKRREQAFWLVFERLYKRPEGTFLRRCQVHAIAFHQAWKAYQNPQSVDIRSLRLAKVIKQIASAAPERLSLAPLLGNKAARRRLENALRRAAKGLPTLAERVAAYAPILHAHTKMRT